MRRATSGFTLVELLVVLLILAALTASAATVLEGVDEQSRYDETRARLEQVRTAILGPPGASRPAGFVADTGRLPRTLDELLRPPADVPAWTIDASTGLAHGWRGPYLRVLAGASGTLELPDGWGNHPLGAPPLAVADDPANFGWVVELAAADTLGVRSRGSDGLDGGAPPYAADVPAGPLVVPADHVLDLTGASLTVTLASPGAPFPGQPLALRVWFPDGGTALRSVLSAATPVALAADERLACAFVFGAGRVPWGARVLEVVREASPGTWDRVGPGPAVQVDLLPRAGLPEVRTLWAVQ